ncbi:MAG: AAA family ATPase [Dolichospermum sp.]
MSGLERAQRIEPPPADGVVLTCGADLRPEPVAWLWPAWLALGKLHVLAGAPGTGKTTIGMELAAGVTTGGWWPDGTRCELPGNCLLIFP